MLESSSSVWSNPNVFARFQLVGVFGIRVPPGMLSELIFHVFVIALELSYLVVWEDFLEQVGIFDGLWGSLGATQIESSDG